MQARLATSSATDWSPVWPMPVQTGRSQEAMARATASWSNAARSALEPPPADHHDDVEGHLPQIGDGGGHHGRGVLALDGGRGDRHGEGQTGAPQAAQEVVVSLGARARHQADA